MSNYEQFYDSASYIWNGASGDYGKHFSTIIFNGITTDSIYIYCSFIKEFVPTAVCSRLCRKKKCPAKGK